MGESPTNPDDIIRQVAERGMGIRFGRGVVAKTGYAMIALLVIWATIAMRLSDSWVQNSALLAVGIISTLVMIWWTRATQTFAERNPAQAMLDGAEFVEYKKFEAQVKGAQPQKALEGKVSKKPSLPRGQPK